MAQEELIAVMLDAFRRDVMNAFASVRQDEAHAREEAVREAEARGRAAGLAAAAAHIRRVFCDGSAPELLTSSYEAVAASVEAEAATGTPASS